GLVRSGGWRWVLDRDLEAELLQASDEASLSGLPVALVEVGRSQVRVGLLTCQHVLGDDEDAVAHGHDGALTPPLGGKTGLRGGPVRRFGMAGAPRRLG